MWPDFTKADVDKMCLKNRSEVWRADKLPFSILFFVQCATHPSAPRCATSGHSQCLNSSRDLANGGTGGGAFFGPIMKVCGGLGLYKVARTANARWPTQKSATIEHDIATPQRPMRHANSLPSLIKWNNGHTAIIISSWPNSTPRLKANRLCQMLGELICRISCKTKEKPRPCKSPIAVVMPNNARSLRLFSPCGESAMIAV